MAASPSFDGLALKYVLADNDELHDISEQAAQAIEESANKRVTVGQWAASIQRWLQSSGDDDLISRAKALDFLASTLQVLSRRDDTLKSDQVTLLVTFFCSLFENDHKAGVTASAKALRQLVVMKHFQPALGENILQGVCKLGDDFKLQAPQTRLEIYRLFQSILGTLAKAYGPGHWQGNANGFIPALLTLCQNERDPENLMVWFTILKTFLHDFNPSTDVTSDIFKAFSAYFPISLRSSTVPTTVTTDDLKLTLRSCFSAHHRVAGSAIPFLIDKLDKVDQTVAVKVDILLTLDACLTEYEAPEQSIVPHSDLIWSSLKYEVRNGEIQDIIKATLKVLCSLSKRLGGEHAQSFLGNAWKDLKEDISDSKYTAQAGRLLVAVVGATPQSFALLVPRALEHIKTTIKHNTSILHKRHLIALMSSLVKLRLHLVSDLDFNQTQPKDRVLLSDELFGDTLFNDLYLPFWRDHSAPSAPLENVGVLVEAMQGLGALVGQVSSGNGPIRQLCSDSTCETIIGLLAKPAIICPLEGQKFLDSTHEIVPEELLNAGEEALRNAVPLYPPSFEHLLLQYLRSLQHAYQTNTHELNLQIRNVSSTLCAIVHSGKLEAAACWVNEAALINTFLQSLQWMLSQQADPKFLVVFVDTIHVTLKRALKLGSTWDATPELTKETFQGLEHQFDANDVPRVDLNRTGKITALATEEISAKCPRRAYYVFVIQQLYRRFTAVSNPSSSPSEFTTVTLGADLDGSDPNLVSREDILLNQLGQLATSVVRTLSEEEQRALNLDYEAFGLFHLQSEDSAQESVLPSQLSPANNFRTAPLSLGIIQGLWPGAIRTEIHLPVLDNLIDVLMTSPMPCSEAARAVMDALVCVLSNKLDAKNNGSLVKQRLQTQERLISKMHDLMGHAHDTGTTGSKIRTFRSILHYLAGDIARPLTGSDQNQLLTLVVDKAPSDVMMGRLFAQNLGLLVMPRESLSDINHPIRKKLGPGWFNHKNVIPYLDRCFPGEGVDEHGAINRAVGTFSILRHLSYDIYSSEAARIVRIGIRSLSTFQVGVETDSLLAVLLHILEKDPAELRGHLAALIQGLVSIYTTARNAAGARQRDSIATRMHTLQFCQKLTESKYDNHLLLPHRRDLLRPLAAACGDSVREIRRTALKARQAWEGLG
ncbi:Dos2-interacting transcription regulator of RNA-Pol-II-domain-containing protein [Xylaria bambusicola]|uniref:Dos2-interacting transcription regulator of RNA-Pol-II-domain-containing protein n=1 Tax=Xylaria bambusicola TaxID=326684 RepID=UPI00200882AB|nr:Dos2-interacting transcription regulator of RNA-Pol-II-domain-containing protein [Xylaria bambusicola]KAI0521368.1 Dos2-interacting transcription regulator of RNA-Pol-II-domain-containing protein [Xylaria bambusicola]